MAKVTLVRRPDEPNGLLKKPLVGYDVTVDGKVVGVVRQGVYTIENRTPGKRYVNSRSYAARWGYHDASNAYYGRPIYETRKRALDTLLRHLGITDYSLKGSR